MHTQIQLPLPTQPCLFELPNLAYLSVLGEKASPFLQGQLTCDLNEITSANMHPGALCNLKGRVLALMDVINWSGEYGLILPENLVTIIQKDLRLVAQLSRVQLKPTSMNCYGLFIPETAKHHYSFLPQKQYELISTNEFACYALHDNLYIIVTRSPSALPELDTLLRKDNLVWHLLLLLNKHPSIYPETSGKFLTHELFQTQNSHVSFNKGCYKGQEIIARMHFKGVNKYRLHLNTLEHETTLLPGMTISHSTQAIGQIIDVVEFTPQHYLVLGNVLIAHEQTFLNDTDLKFL